jgi:hypothetical protein
MGVLACHRNGCENIMCERYSVIYGYICDECFAELLANKADDIQEFMNSEKRIHREFYDTYADYLDAEFKRNDS